MILRRFIFSAVIAFAIMLGGVATFARAQMPVDPMGLPIHTIIVLRKPAPGETFENRPIISVGVGTAVYKFILKDGYTNHMYVRWPSIWELCRQSSPNLNAQGQDSEKFAEVQPGTTVTVSGMFTAAQRTFEVVGIEEGESFHSGDRHY